MIEHLLRFWRWLNVSTPTLPAVVRPIEPMPKPPPYPVKDGKVDYFANNCAVQERTADGIPVGRCWFYLEDGVCPRHGRQRERNEFYVNG